MIREMLVLDELDQKLADAFPGRVVRKDLVRQTKTGFNVPVYVLEYLLGQYCASTDPEIVTKGLDYVRDTLSRNYVRADESEKVKALTRQKGRHRISPRQHHSESSFPGVEVLLHRLHGPFAVIILVEGAPSPSPHPLPPWYLLSPYASSRRGGAPTAPRLLRSVASSLTYPPGPIRPPAPQVPGERSAPS